MNYITWDEVAFLILILSGVAFVTYVLITCITNTVEIEGIKKHLAVLKWDMKKKK